MTRQQLCAEMGHPGTTYNPWSDTTWCACGWVTYADRPRAVIFISTKGEAP